MQTVYSVFGRVRKSGVLVWVGLVVAGVVALVGAGSGRASAQDCNANAIINCGFSSPSQFISKVRAGSSGNGHRDLSAIYAAYGLEPASYDQFVTAARQGTAYKDGRIVVDGQVVATSARSIGRLASYQGSGYFTQTINGVQYYGNSNQRAFASGSIPVTVLFNDRGVMQFAVLNSCGNPESGSKVTPSYSCTALHKTAVSGQANTYRFTTSATASHNASISKLVYDFGDGSTMTTTSPTTAVTHHYAGSGSFTAKVTVYVRLPGKQTVTAPSGHCQTTITVAPPPKPPKPQPTPQAACVALTGARLDQQGMSFSFTVRASFSSGVTFTSADFDFGDGATQTGVHPDSSTTASVTHAYQTAGNFTASAVLHFTAADGQGLTAPTCMAAVAPTTPPTPAPPVLPNTGAGDVIGVVAGTTALGTLGYRFRLARRLGRR